MWCTVSQTYVFEDVGDAWGGAAHKQARRAKPYHHTSTHITRAPFHKHTRRVTSMSCAIADELHPEYWACMQEEESQGQWRMQYLLIYRRCTRMVGPCEEYSINTLLEYSTLLPYSTLLQYRINTLLPTQSIEEESEWQCRMCRRRW